MACESHSAEDRGAGRGPTQHKLEHSDPFKAKGQKATMEGGKGRRGRYVTLCHLPVLAQATVTKSHSLGAYTTDICFLTVWEL